MLLLRVIDRTMIVYLAGVVAALLSMAIFTLIGALFAVGTMSVTSFGGGLIWAAGGLAQLFCLWTFYLACGLWWRYVVRMLDIQGFGRRTAAVAVGSVSMAGLLLSTCEIFRFLVPDAVWAPGFHFPNLILFSLAAVVLIFAGRWQMRYNFHSSGFGPRVMDSWLLTAEEQRRLLTDFD